MKTTPKNGFIPFALPDISCDEIEEVTDTLRSGWLTTGKKTALFEKNFAQYIGAKHALAVNSGTAGLHLALEAVGVGPGDEVIVPDYTFTASAEIIRYLGADPVFADIDPKTLNMDPVEIRKALTPRTKAIIPVHFGGQACDMTEIMEIAKKHGLKIVEDAAHAIPCTHMGKMIGTIGDATVYSFYVTKPIATGEGGMVVTDSDEIAARIKVMRLHGINRDIWDRYTTNKPNWHYEVVAPGFKYNMPDITAAIGIHQLKKVDNFQQKRKKIATIYNQAFEGLPVELPYVAVQEDIHSWHLYVIRMNRDLPEGVRDRFMEKMAEKGVGTSVHFIPLHLHPYWKDRYCLQEKDFPNSASAFQRVVSLPIYTKMTDDEVDYVASTVKEVIPEIA